MGQGVVPAVAHGNLRRDRRHHADLFSLHRKWRRLFRFGCWESRFGFGSSRGSLLSFGLLGSLDLLQFLTILGP
jgi:hypothetical protein